MKRSWLSDARRRQLAGRPIRPATLTPLDAAAYRGLRARRSSRSRVVTISSKMRNSLRALTAIPACHALLRQLVRCVLLAGAVCTLPGEQLHAQDRMFRRYAAGQGFNGAPVSALAQDARGFLWIGGQNGLYRYDGIEFRRWAGRDLDGPVLSIATSTAGRLVVLTADGVLYEIVEKHKVVRILTIQHGRRQS